MPVLPDSASLIAYDVRRSDRAATVRVRVDRDARVEVVLPRRAPAAAAERAVRELRPWIERQLAHAARQQAIVAARAGTLPYLSLSLRLCAEAGRTQVTRRGEELLVPADASARTAIERWYRRMAREEISARLARASARSGLAYSGLAIRDQRTRWGSCSRTGALSFNWRLLLAPEPVLDYVIWHELCHLAAPDHSPRFWALVAAHCPDYRERAGWLRANSATLVL